MNAIGAHASERNTIISYTINIDTDVRQFFLQAGDISGFSMAITHHHQATKDPQKTTFINLWDTIFLYCVFTYDWIMLLFDQVIVATAGRCCDIRSANLTRPPATHSTCLSVFLPASRRVFFAPSPTPAMAWSSKRWHGSGSGSA